MLSVILTLYPGRLIEGAVLGMNQDCMRVVLKGDEDTLELRRVEGSWRGEDNHPVDFEVLLTDGHADVDRFEGAKPRVMAAGCV